MRRNPARKDQSVELQRKCWQNNKNKNGGLASGTCRTLQRLLLKFQMTFRIFIQKKRNMFWTVLRKTFGLILGYGGEASSLKTLLKVWHRNLFQMISHIDFQEASGSKGCADRPRTLLRLTSRSVSNILPNLTDVPHRGRRQHHVRYRMDVWTE